MLPRTHGLGYEVHEPELKSLLRTKCPFDMVGPVLEGELGWRRAVTSGKAFSSAQNDLDKERKAIMKQWVKRRAEAEHVMGATVGALAATCKA